MISVWIMVFSMMVRGEPSVMVVQNGPVPMVYETLQECNKDKGVGKERFPNALVFCVKINVEKK